MAAPARISQIAVVVYDLEKSMKAYHDLLGWGPWNVYEHVPPALHHTHLRGTPTKYSMLGAETNVEGMGFEIIQPLEGPSIYKEWLDKYGEGFHHIAVMKHTAEESEQFKKRWRPGGEDPHGGPDRRDHRVLLPGHRPRAEDHRGVRNGHAIDLKPSRVFP